ncbi:beta-hydroxyacyl-(acyl-carrier-protein) dehydratase FabZ [Thermincola ferriacetica]|uniref:3-hydroxyacyl-[acyl-carrier-protein] dehydratase FabZ n=1 Tax=Thermincola ferriacetica TaxID=281456 RepID=A0A0L6W3B5_9FIRM|nr:3-hydroxyacyl-ACP dehydratase FabZ [Thermincola ferriacetica]KNZ70072.1 beta-hydroxyacyl-(acyl-carrier-protein) dehydratase FabZ [Thermincola ferriacetica]
MLDINRIKEILPHRYPFLLVDRIIEMDENKVVGQKNVSANEEYFQGHFPNYPVMPGVLIIEALAQTGAVYILSKPEFKGKIAFFAGLDKVRFRKQVVPGDQLRLEVEMLKLRGRVGKAFGRAFVGDQLVAEAELMFAIGE